MTSNQNNDGGNDGWGSQPNRWHPPFYMTEWEHLIAEEHAQATEVKNVVSELIEAFGGVNCEGLVYFFICVARTRERLSPCCILKN